MKTKRQTYAESFADYVIDAIARTNLRQSDIAKRAGVSRQWISQIVGKKPNTTTGKLMLPERETVDAIANAFGDPVSLARRAAGYDASDPSDGSVHENLEVGTFIEQAFALFNKIPKVYRKKVLETIQSVYGEDGSPQPVHKFADPVPVGERRTEAKKPNGNQEKKV